MCSTTGATIPRIQLCFRVDREALVDVTRALPGITRRRQDGLAATPTPGGKHNPYTSCRRPLPKRPNILEYNGIQALRRFRNIA